MPFQSAGLRDAFVNRLADEKIIERLEALEKRVAELTAPKPADRMAAARAALAAKKAAKAAA